MCFDVFIDTVSSCCQEMLAWEMLSLSNFCVCINAYNFSWCRFPSMHSSIEVYFDKHRRYRLHLACSRTIEIVDLLVYISFHKWLVHLHKRIHCITIKQETPVCITRSVFYRFNVSNTCYKGNLTIYRLPCYDQSKVKCLIMNVPDQGLVVMNALKGKRCSSRFYFLVLG